MTSRRGTSNGNERGSAAQRRKRRQWVLFRFQSLYGLGWTHCYRCNTLLDYDTMTLDRIVPGCQGGRYVKWNIRPCCGSCNSITGATIRASIVHTERKGWHMRINEAVRQMHPPRYTVKQAAQMIGRDADTLRRWKRSGTLIPSDHEKFGKTVVPLYTDDDIKVGREIAKSIKPGRKSAQPV